MSEAAATKSIVVHTSAERLFAVIIDYEAYPQFLSNMKAVRLIKREGNTAEVEFDFVLLGKSFSYTLEFEENRPKGVKWRLVRSTFVQENHGSWGLRADGETKTHATYSLEIKLKLPLPKSTSTAIAGAELPKILEAFKKRAEG